MVKGKSRNEVGAAVCRFDTGALAFGKFTEGHPTGVDVVMQCPAGSKAIAIYHTHPELANGSGGSSRPSDVDVAAARKVGVNLLCVNGEGKLDCWRVSPETK